jgi:hypothetical protein
MTMGGPNVDAVAGSDHPGTERSGSRLGQLDEQLLAFVTAHVTSEAELLATYQTTADEAPDEHVRYLLRLIISDEQRHHQLLGEMASYLRAGVDGTDVRPRIPWLTRPKHPAALRATTKLLIQAERRDRRELRRYRRQLRPLRHTSLLGVLVDSMLLDTKKHLLLLRAVRRGTHR